MGSSNENSAFGPVKNPWDIARVSGGSRVARQPRWAAGPLCPLALGSDTGGSVRTRLRFAALSASSPYGRILVTVWLPSRRHWIR